MGRSKVTEEFEEPVITFVSTIEGLTQIPECLPKLSQKYVPDWWRTVPNIDNKPSLDHPFLGNVKDCPSFTDYFSYGYIMPMWADTIMYVDSETKNWRWRTSDPKFLLDVHYDEQYLNFAPHKYLGNKTYCVVKTVSPWKALTPPGWSLYQLPVFFDFNEDFSAIPGIRDTDFYHSINTQLLIHSNKKEIFIPRGTPIAHYVPIKKQPIKLNIKDLKDLDKKEQDSLDAHSAHFSTKFLGQRQYLNIRKEKNE